MLASSMDLLGKDPEAPLGAAAIAVWECVWAVVDRFTADVRAVLGSHLRDGVVGAVRFRSEGRCRIGAITVGRTRLRLECPLDTCQAGARETSLREVFGAEAALVRIFVFRDSYPAPARLESMLVAEPSSARWIATEPEMGPASLRDVEALSCFLWSLLADLAE
ncbi:MAG: hypothetical protein ABW298_09885 [Candidatus Binatia bacterium]